MNSETPPVRNEGSSSSMLAVIVVAVIVLSALALLWVLLVGGFSIPADQAGDRIEEGQVAAKTDKDGSLEDEPSKLPSDDSGAAEDVIEQPAPTEPDDMTTPTGKPEPSSTPRAAKTSLPATDGVAARDDAANGKDFLSLLPPFETVGVKTNGGPVRRSVVFSGEEHQHGIWAQPHEDRGTTQVSYLLKGQYTGLRGKAGICDAPDDARISDNANPSGVLRIYGDGNLLWESVLLTGFGAVTQLDIEVKGIELLALTVESNSPAEWSRFAWGNLELIKDEE